MHRVAKYVLLLFTLLPFCSIASAQARFGRGVRSTARIRGLTVRPAPARLPVAPQIGRVVVPTTPTTSSGPASFTSGQSTFTVLNGSSIDVGQLLNSGIPGLGFDYSHLAAMNANLGERALVDPVTQQELALSEKLLRETPTAAGSFALFDAAPVVVVPPQQQQQPPIIILQQPQAPAAASAVAPEPAASGAETPQAPLPDVGEFTLVLTDGTQVKAVAFTRENDQMVYITKEGLRRSFPISEFDANKTQQINREHGTPLRLSS
jgi:hypothetical protein